MIRIAYGSRENRMSMQGHLEELVRRHQALEKEIEHESVSPAGDDLKVIELKRKKLVLKQEIEKLRTSPTVH